MPTSGSILTFLFAVPVNQTGSQSSDDSSASSHISSSGWLGGDEDMTPDQNGESFRDKVDHLLTNKEKSSLRKALMNYNMHRYTIFTNAVLCILLLTCYVLPNTHRSKFTSVIYILPCRTRNITDYLHASEPRLVNVTHSSLRSRQY